MKKRTKKISKKPNRSLPSLVEEFAQLLRAKAHNQQRPSPSKAAPSASMSSVVEQIAVLLRKEMHKKPKTRRSSKKRRPAKKIKNK